MGTFVCLFGICSCERSRLKDIYQAIGHREQVWTTNHDPYVISPDINPSVYINHVLDDEIVFTSSYLHLMEIALKELKK